MENRFADHSISTTDIIGKAISLDSNFKNVMQTNPPYFHIERRTSNLSYSLNINSNHEFYETFSLLDSSPNSNPSNNR